MTNCKNCGVALITRQTRRTPEQLKKQFYFTAYYLCPACGRMYHDEKFKVVNQNMEMFSRDTGSTKPFETEIWTDGACTNNGNSSAKAAWAFVAGEYEEGGRVEGKQTNNRGEGLAIYHALVWAAAKGHKRIRIHTDSQITIHGATKDPSKVKENRNIFQDIHDVVVKNSLEIEYVKVLGHSGDINNERADKLANTLASF